MRWVAAGVFTLVSTGGIVAAVSCAPFGSTETESVPGSDGSTNVPGADGGADGSAATRFCASRPGAFRCFDFDGDPAEDAGFTEVAGFGTTLRITTDDATSAPASLLAETTSTKEPSYFVVDPVPVSRALRLEAAVRIDTVEPGVTLYVMGLQVGMCSLLLYAQPDVLFVKEYNAQTAEEQIVEFPLRNGWMQASIRVDVAATPPTIHVASAGEPASLPVGCGWTKGGYRTVFGLHQAFGTFSARQAIRLDNIVIEPE